jgi:hypothetical protein
MQETFYATFAQVSIALLGLWWVVVQFRHAEWMQDRARRRMAYNVSLYFMLPGLMALVSILSVDATFIWRGTFAVAGAFGAIEAARAALDREPPGPGWYDVARWLTVALYVAVVVVALFPGIVASVGISLTPIQFEGLTLSVILFLGLNWAWLMFATDQREDSSPG